MSEEYYIRCKYARMKYDDCHLLCSKGNVVEPQKQDPFVEIFACYTINDHLYFSKGGMHERSHHQGIWTF